MHIKHIWQIKCLVHSMAIPTSEQWEIYSQNVRNWNERKD